MSKDENKYFKVIIDSGV